MQQRGRSSTNLTLISNAPVRHRVTPPAGCTRAEAKCFNEILASCHPDHFLPSDAELLLSYVQAVLTVRRLARKHDAFKAWETANKVQNMLARTLRLTPRSRTSPKTVTRRGRTYQPSAYDLMDLENDA